MNKTSFKLTCLLLIVSMLLVHIPAVAIFNDDPSDDEVSSNEIDNGIDINDNNIVDDIDIEYRELDVLLSILDQYESFNDFEKQIIDGYISSSYDVIQYNDNDTESEKQYYVDMEIARDERLKEICMFTDDYSIATDTVKYFLLLLLELDDVKQDEAALKYAELSLRGYDFYDSTQIMRIYVKGVFSLDESIEVYSMYPDLLERLEQVNKFYDFVKFFEIEEHIAANSLSALNVNDNIKKFGFTEEQLTHRNNNAAYIDYDAFETAKSMFLDDYPSENIRAASIAGVSLQDEPVVFATKKSADVLKSEYSNTLTSRNNINANQNRQSVNEADIFIETYPVDYDVVESISSLANFNDILSSFSGGIILFAAGGLGSTEPESYISAPFMLNPGSTGEVDAANRTATQYEQIAYIPGKNGFDLNLGIKYSAANALVFDYETSYVNSNIYEMTYKVDIYNGLQYVRSMYCTESDFNSTALYQRIAWNTYPKMVNGFRHEYGNDYTMRTRSVNEIYYKDNVARKNNLGVGWDWDIPSIDNEKLYLPGQSYADYVHYTTYSEFIGVYEWYIYCINRLTGTTYYFNYYTKKIYKQVDRIGNTIYYNYNNNEELIEIIDSAGRVISIDYDNTLDRNITITLPDLSQVIIERENLGITNYSYNVTKVTKTDSTQTTEVSKSYEYELKCFAQEGNNYQFHSILTEVTYNTGAQRIYEYRSNTNTLLSGLKYYQVLTSKLTYDNQDYDEYSFADVLYILHVPTDTYYDIDFTVDNSKIIRNRSGYKRIPTNSYLTYSDYIGYAYDNTYTYFVERIYIEKTFNYDPSTGYVNKNTYNDYYTREQNSGRLYYSLKQSQYEYYTYTGLFNSNYFPLASYTGDYTINYTNYDNVTGNLLRKEIIQNNSNTNINETYVYQYTYDNSGNLINEAFSVTTGYGIGTNTTYDYTDNVLGRGLDDIYVTSKTVTGVTDADGVLVNSTGIVSESYMYDIMGRLIAVTDGNGNTVEMVYDFLGRVIGINYPDNTSVTYDYDYDANTLLFTAQDGSETFYQYDPFGLLESVIDINNNIILQQFIYDDVFRLIEERNAQGENTTRKIVYTYNGRDKIVDNTKKVYDSLNNLVYNESTIGSVNVNTTTIAGDLNTEPYDCIKVHNTYTDLLNYEYIQYSSVNYITTYYGYSYTATSPAISTKKINNLVEYFKHDHYSKAVNKYTNENGVVTTYSNDVYGNVYEEKDAKGNITYYRYDQLGRLIEKKIPIKISSNIYSITRYYYDNNSNLIKEKQSNNTDISSVLTWNTREYVYDNMNRVTETIVYVNANDKIYTHYEYDPMGRIAEMYTGMNALYSNLMTSVDYSLTIYTYDRDGNVTSVTDALGNTETFVYDNNGYLVEKTERDGKRTVYVYDCMGNELSSTVYSTNNVLLSTRTTVYDRHGKVLSVTENGYTITYTYDKGQVISESETGGIVKDYTYYYANNGDIKYGNLTNFDLKINNVLKDAVLYNYITYPRLYSVTNNSIVTGYTYDATSIISAITTGGNLRTDNTFN